MKRHIVELDRVVREIVTERRADPGDVPTLLNMFIDARDDDGKGMSDTQLRDEVLTMLHAGHETTANALSWTFYCVSKHPEVARRLEAELDSVLDGQAPTMEEVRDLPYTTQVLKESMRLYPPAWTIGRRAEEDDEIGGHAIPPNSLVLMSPYVLHRHPDYWENPEAFDPERFRPDKAPPARGSYMPFLVGPCKCIGEHFAMTEAVIVVAIKGGARRRFDHAPQQRNLRAIAQLVKTIRITADFVSSWCATCASGTAPGMPCLGLAAWFFAAIALLFPGLRLAEPRCIGAWLRQVGLRFPRSNRLF